MSSSDRHARSAVRRASIRLHKTRLGESDADFSPVRGVEALTLVTQLTRESWSASGRGVPRLDRSELA